MSQITVENIKRSSETVARSTRGVSAAWVNFDGTGTIAARDSENVSSLTDNGTGIYTVSFTNNFSDGNYAPDANGGDYAVLGRAVGGASNAARLAGSFELRTLNETQAVLTDCDAVFVTSFGDLA